MKNIDYTTLIDFDSYSPVRGRKPYIMFHKRLMAFLIHIAPLGDGNYRAGERNGYPKIFDSYSPVRGRKLIVKTLQYCRSTGF